MRPPDLLERIQEHTGVAMVGVVLVLLTLMGLAASKPLTRTLPRAALFAVPLFGWTILWWLVNSPLEGRTLLVVSYTHGFTLADTLGVPALILAFVLVGVALARRPQRPQGPGMRMSSRPSSGSSAR